MPVQELPNFFVFGFFRRTVRLPIVGQREENNRPGVATARCEALQPRLRNEIEEGGTRHQMSSGENAWIVQPPQILAACLDARVHPLSADYELVPSCGDVVSATCAPRRHLSSRFGEQNGIAVDD